MYNRVVIFLTFMIFVSNNHAKPEDEKQVLSRRKRYVVFPEGASLTVALCYTINMLGMPTDIFTEVINFGINYDLPNKTRYHLPNFAEPKHLLQRRHRRDLYNKVEILLNGMGFDGKSCVYRALCESAQNLFSRKGNLLEELISVVFRFPLEKLRNHEPEDHRLYHWAYRIGHESQDCYELFPNCPLSIIDIFLGYKPIAR